MMGQIRNQAQYDRGIWDWSFLQGCFGANSRITPTDIDGCIERHGKFLYIETKRPGIEVPAGQMIVLQQLARQGDTVLIVHGEQNQVQHIAKLTAYEERHYADANNETLRQIVADWYAWADGQTDIPAPHKMAKLLRTRMGEDYCNVVAAKWTEE